jgi:hypothetical protein
MSEINETRISKLENDMQTIKTELGSLTQTIFGIHGEGGFLRKFDSFMTRWATREEDKKEYDDRMEAHQQTIMNQVKEIRERRMFWLTVISVVCGFLLAIVAVMTYEKEFKHSSLFSDSGVYSAQENTGHYDSKAE